MKFMKRSALILAAILLVGGSFAYFTDRATTSAQGTAGTVAIELNNMINLLDEDGHDIIAPGDMRDAKFEIVNMGNKSIDVRTTMAITVDSEHYDLSFSGDGSNQSEYDLFLRDDVKFVEGYGYMPKEGSSPLQAKLISDNVIFYELPEYSLNGNSDAYSEVETINGTGVYSHLYDYVLVFKCDTPNEWQDSEIQIDLLVEAKQHENTQAGWSLIATETVTQGSITKDAAVTEDIITQ